jgi:hypothetical protein
VSPVDSRIAPDLQDKFILGSQSDMRHKGKLQLLIDAWHEHGDVVRPDVIFLFHPDR